MIKIKLIIFAICAILSTVKGNEVRINLMTNLFAKTEYTITVNGKANELLNWNIQTLGRTFRSGSSNFNEKGIVKIKFITPNVNPGVILPFQMNCIVNNLKKQRDFYVFYENPFSLHKKIIKDLGLCIYDLSENEKVSDIFEKLEVDFKTISNLDEFDGKVLIISDLNFENFHGLEDDIFAQVANGKNIIFISNTTGTLPLNNNKIHSIELLGNEVVHKYNKKYDKLVLSNNISFCQIDDITHLDFGKNKTPSFAFCKVKIGEGNLIFIKLNLNKKSSTEIHLLKDIIIKKGVVK